MAIAVNLIAVLILAALAWIFLRNYEPHAPDADRHPAGEEGERE